MKERCFSNRKRTGLCRYYARS